MNLSDAGSTETESTHGPSGRAFRNVWQEQAARKLAEMTPLLTETLTHHWSTGQGTRVRHITARLARDLSADARQRGDAEAAHCSR